MVWSPDGGLAGHAALGRPDRPYVVGQWCNQTSSLVAPNEAADHLREYTPRYVEDWDALSAAGFPLPLDLGEGPTGGVGGDIFQVSEVVNGSPHIYALWPHVASLFYRARRHGRIPSGDRARSQAGPGPRVRPEVSPAGS
jgi:hypothetical protein